MWFVFAILGALFDALHFALVKRFLKEINQFVLACVSFFIVSVILFVISIIKGIPEISPSFYIAVLATVVLNILITIFYYRALKITDLSLAVPMSSFTPVFLIVTSFIILREFPSNFGIIGIILIVFGSYILNMKGSDKKFLDPIKNILTNKGVLMVLIIAFLASISTNFDKLVVTNSDAVFGSAVAYLLLAVSFFIISIYKKYEIRNIVRNNLYKFFVVGLPIVFVVIFINLAYTMQIVSYVISLKRLSIIFSVLFGVLFFKEKNILRRSIGALIMLAGAIIIILI